LDNRAFELVSGDGFIHLAQTIFDVVKDLYKSQSIDDLDLLPNPTTVNISYSEKIESHKVIPKDEVLYNCR